MKKRNLGNTGMEVSEVAFGGVEIGMPYGIGVNGAEDMLPEAQAVRLLHAALDSGVDFFDTARMYGNSEHIMGKAFRDRREKVILCTKCRHLLDSEGNLPAGAKLKEAIEQSLHESLAALCTDRIDLFMLHQAGGGILDNDEIPEIFAEFKAQGLIRASGVSTYTTVETRKAIESGVWNVIQLPFNLMDQRQSALFEEAARQGIGIVIRSVLLKGLLSDRGRNLHPALKQVEEHIAGYGGLLGSTGLDLPALAMKFALSFPEVASVLVGIDRPEYLEQALCTANGEYLDAARLAEARRAAYPDPEFINLPHWDKMNWLK